MDEKILQDIWKQTRNLLRECKSKFRFQVGDFKDLLKVLEDGRSKDQIPAARLVALTCVLGPKAASPCVTLIQHFASIANKERIPLEEPQKWIYLILAYGLELTPQINAGGDRNGKWPNAVHTAGVWMGGAAGSVNHWLKKTVPGYREIITNEANDECRNENISIQEKYEIIYKLDAYSVLYKVLDNPKSSNQEIKLEYLYNSLTGCVTGGQKLRGNNGSPAIFLVKAFTTKSVYYEMLNSEEILNRNRRLDTIWTNQEKSTNDGNTIYSVKQLHLALFYGVIRLKQQIKKLEKDQETPPIIQMEEEGTEELQGLYDALKTNKKSKIQNEVQKLKAKLQDPNLDEETRERISEAIEAVEQEYSTPVTTSTNDSNINEFNQDFQNNEETQRFFRIIGGNPLYTLTYWYACQNRKKIHSKGAGEIIYKPGTTCVFCENQKDSQNLTPLIERIQ